MQTREQERQEDSGAVSGATTGCANSPPKRRSESRGSREVPSLCRIHRGAVAERSSDSVATNFRSSASKLRLLGEQLL